MFQLRKRIFFRALLLGIATGHRSQIANGMLALHHDDAPRRAGWRNWPVFRNPWGRKALIASSAGELVADKLPVVPSRLEPPTLMGRLAFGGLAGAAIGSEGAGRRSVIQGAILGATGALIGNYSGYHTRKAIVDATGLPDPAVALAEDATAIALANAAVGSQ